MQPIEQQQTVQRSFTLGGVGLHSGQYAFVCVKPALAGEGRYFVRVPPGPNAADYRPEAPQLLHHSELDITRGADDGVSDDNRGQLFLQYLEAVDNKKFKGTFGDYIKEKVGDPTDTFWMDMIAQGAPEDAKPRDAREEFVRAFISNAEAYNGAATLLTGDDLSILSPEALLSALEACGVDNARIEIEGGADEGDDSGVQDIGPMLEVPVVDGSALGWVLEIQKAGLKEASPSSNGSQDALNRSAPAPQEMLTVREGDSFISFYPGLDSKITAGVDFSADSDIIGRQWYTWGPDDSTATDNYDLHYRWEIAPARTVLPSIAAAEDMYASGMLRAGPEDCCLVGNGDSWFDPGLVRFPEDEAARKAIADLVGNLSLAAEAGGRGVPQGHVVAYRASTELQLQFVKALDAKAQQWAYGQVEN